ncbi:MAG TPA: dienelactone hydrolase family protein [Nitriliruptoraceae bacterium]|nr:dienelactone hydrolase family protein [Nitriliruptoraceae bacterium]
MSEQAYFVGPETVGPGVLVLPSWWGGDFPLRRRADALADEGFTALVPDLNFGARPTTLDEAEALLAEADPDRLDRAVQASAGLLADRSAAARIAVVGFGMGGSLALWLSVRRPDLVAACVSVYGNQSIDFAGADARYQLHFAADDPFISDDDATFLEATMRMEDLEVEVVTHGDTVAGFADESGPHFDEQATTRLWEQVVAFLHMNHPTTSVDSAPEAD